MEGGWCRVGWTSAAAEGRGGGEGRGRQLDRAAVRARVRLAQLLDRGGDVAQGWHLEHVDGVRVVQDVLDQLVGVGAGRAVESRLAVGRRAQLLAQGSSQFTREGIYV